MYNAAWLRKSKGLSKRKMASLMHTSVQSITKIENGILPKRLSTDFILLLADSFNVRPAILLMARLDKEV